MIPYLFVFLGGGLGAVIRYLGGVLWGRAFGHGFGWGATLVINVLGGLAMGILISTLALRGGGDQEKWRLFLGVGVLGGFTTFSTFSLETVMMLQRRDYPIAAAYVLGSVVLSILALMLGLFLTRKVLA